MSVKQTAARLGIVVLVAAAALGILVLAGREEAAGWVAALILIVGGVLIAYQAARADLAKGRRRR